MRGAGGHEPRRRGRARAALLCLVLAALTNPLAPRPAAAQSPFEASSPAPDPARLAELPERHREFLEAVALLATAEEQAAFLALERDYQRDAFVRRFWQVRDPFPETARNELAERWEARVVQARERYASLADDRSNALLLFGEPRESLRSLCPGVLRPLEIWLYEDAGPVRGAFSLVFVQVAGSDDPHRLWYPTAGLAPILSLAASAGGDAAEVIAAGCPRGTEVVDALGSAMDLGAVASRGVRFVPEPSGEWLSSFLARSTDIPAGARTLPGTLSLSFPGRRGSRTIVQGLVSVPRDAATAATAGSHSSYGFLVDGEVLREGELFEQFRYRFDFPSDEAPEASLPLVLQRALRPGRYRLVVRVEDVGGEAYLRREVDLEVPRVAGAVERPTIVVETVPTAGEGPPDEGSGSVRAGHDALAAELAEANATLERGGAATDHLVRLLPPPPGLQTGKLRVEALTEGPDIARVAFALDGRRILAKTRPPFSVELDLGATPKIHRLEAVAEAPEGGELARDEILLNAGPHRFGIRLVEPRSGGRYRRSLKANAVVDVPEGERLERVEIFLNDQRLATLYAEPFVQPLLLPPEAEAGEMLYVRAVAYLEGGTSAEDVVFVNTPEHLEEMDVDLVELYTSVLDRRDRPVDGLSRRDFRVFEDGEPQEIRRFERVRDLPIYAGVLLDTSTSMIEEIDDAVDAAITFFDTVITPRDRAAVITFNHQPELAVRFTSDVGVLSGSLAGLAPEGETALWDSVVYGLYYFSGIQGKRVIVLISDGEDSRSRYRFDEALEYARRTGVAIYTVGLGFDTRQTEGRSRLSSLASETGGRSFFIERVSQLDRVYADIEAELRSQYLLAYQSARRPSEADTGRFREVRVEMERPDLEATTIKGYYP